MVSLAPVQGGAAPRQEETGETGGSQEAYRAADITQHQSGNLHKSLKSGLEVDGGWGWGGVLNTCRKGRPCAAAAGGCTTPPPVTRFPFCTFIPLAENKQSTDESG